MKFPTSLKLDNFVYDQLLLQSALEIRHELKKTPIIIVFFIRFPHGNDSCYNSFECV